jgi:hypothetical protein
MADEMEENGAAKYLRFFSINNIRIHLCFSVSICG